MSLSYELRVPPVDDFWDLFETTGWNDEYHLSAEELIHAVLNSTYVLSVYDGVHLVGFGRVVSDEVVHAMIYDLIVDPGYRRRGIGAEILGRLVKLCRQSGFRDIQLFSARGKRGFYERLGFKARAEDSPGMQYVGDGAV